MSKKYWSPDDFRIKEVQVGPNEIEFIIERRIYTQKWWAFASLKRTDNFEELEEWVGGGEGYNKVIRYSMKELAEMKIGLYLKKHYETNSEPKYHNLTKEGNET